MTSTSDSLDMVNKAIESLSKSFNLDDEPATNTIKEPSAPQAQPAPQPQAQDAPMLQQQEQQYLPIRYVDPYPQPPPYNPYDNAVGNPYRNKSVDTSIGNPFSGISDWNKKLMNDINTFQKQVTQSNYDEKPYDIPKWIYGTTMIVGLLYVFAKKTVEHKEHTRDIMG